MSRWVSDAFSNWSCSQSLGGLGRDVGTIRQVPVVNGSIYFDLASWFYARCLWSCLWTKVEPAKLVFSACILYLYHAHPVFPLLIHVGFYSVISKVEQKRLDKLWSASVNYKWLEMLETTRRVAERIVSSDGFDMYVCLQSMLGRWSNVKRWYETKSFVQ